MSTPINEYLTVSATSAAALDRSVNEHIKLGYQPYGSPYILYSVYLQAVVKYETCAV
ncbi:MAG: DUF1737 domain-containing protein [Chthoniobacterales bacterium]